MYDRIPPCEIGDLWYLYRAFFGEKEALMKYRNILGIIGILLLPGCWQSAQKKDGLVVVNVLDKELYDDCHIKDSINIPFEIIEEQAAAVINKNAEIVVYCSNYQCSTSEYAARKLSDQGFTNVSVYEGGTAEWFQEGLPVEGPHRQSYLVKPSRQLPYEKNGVIPVITVGDLAHKMGLQPSQKKAA